MVIVGDRILLKIDDDQDKTKSGLYLPPSGAGTEKVAIGRVVKVGPGYADPQSQLQRGRTMVGTPKNPMRYIPLQAQEGDYAIFLREQGIEVEFEEDKYLIVPQSAVLMLVRRELEESSAVTTEAGGARRMVLHRQRPVPQSGTGTCIDGLCPCRDQPQAMVTSLLR